MIPQSLQDLKRLFTKLPGVGPRQAERYAFFVLKQPADEREALIAALTSLANVELCRQCFLPTEKSATPLPTGQAGLCDICSDPKREQTSICIVEKESDVLNMEKAKAYQGTYLILSENISPLSPAHMAKDRLKTLTPRMHNLPKTHKKEIILALNATREGNFTTLYIQELLKKRAFPNTKVSRLGRGLATGSELEYADEETLRHAIEGRG